MLLAGGAAAAGVLVLVLDLRSPAVRIAPLEIVPIVLIALLIDERVALYAALAFATLTVVLGHLVGMRPIAPIAVLNGVILAVSYAVALVVVTAARRMSQQMSTLTQEAADAKRVHDALFPESLDHSPAWEIDVIHIPLRGVGGDYFCVGRRADETMVFVADVSGKGVQAAMLLAALKTLCDASAGRRIEPSAEFATINRALLGVSTAEMFATAWLGVLHDDGRVHYASAGHELALVRAAGRLRHAEGGGLPLGVEHENRSPEFTIALEPGDAIVVYSDGISDLLDRGELDAGELFADFSGLKRRLPGMKRRDDVLALRLAYRGG